MTSVYVRMRVGAEHYGLDVGRVRQVAELGPIAPVPGAPDAVMGVINVHGQILPVIDTALLLGAVVSETDRPRRVVIVHDGPRRAGLAVNEVVDVAPAPESSEQSDSPLLTGAGLVDEELVGFLDLDALLRAAA